MTIPPTAHIEQRPLAASACIRGAAREDQSWRAGRRAEHGAKTRFAAEHFGTPKAPTGASTDSWPKADAAASMTPEPTSLALSPTTPATEIFEAMQERIRVLEIAFSRMTPPPAPLSPKCYGSTSTAGLRIGLYLFSLRTGSWRSRQSSSHVNESGRRPAKVAAPFNRNSLGPTVERVANTGRTARTRNTRNWTARLMEPIELVFSALLVARHSPRVDDTGFFASFTGGFPSRANAAVGYAQNQDMNGDCSLSGRYTDAGRLAPDIGHLGDTI
jgi:hypothetical protein